MANFKNFIEILVSKWNLPSKVASIMLSDKAISIYKISFTPSISLSGSNSDESLEYPRAKDYEAYEQIGDAIIKSFMATYFYRRFPKLWINGTGVKIVARLMIKYGSKEVLSDIAEKHDFWNHIQTPIDVTSQQRRASILEDIFEAFIGATTILFDHHFEKVGHGYVIAYTILEILFDQMNISLAYDSLFDAKTRLKELVDYFKDKLGQITYSYDREEQCNVVHVIQVQNGQQKIIGAGKSALKTKAEQSASEQALDYLKLNGFIKKIQKEYNDLL